jgi:hypothetical protein
MLRAGQRQRGGRQAIGIALGALLATGPAGADEASFEDAPAGSSVDSLDGSLARGVDVRIRQRTLFPRLKQALQNLPPFVADTELTFRARTYYLPLVELDGTRANAWTVGGKLRYRSGWLRERLQIGAGIYTSYKLVADDPLALTQLLRPEEQGFTIFGEAFLRLRHRDNDLTLGRQELDLPYVNRAYSRMAPNSFQGAFGQGVARGVPLANRVDWKLAYISDIRPRNEEDFISMAERAGAVDGDAGMVVTALALRPRENLHVGLQNYFVKDTLNTLYVAVDWTRYLQHDWALRIQGQFTHQMTVGANLLPGPSYKTWVAGGRAAVSWRGWTAWLAASQTRDEAPIISPWGTYPGYTSLMQSDFNRADETAWLIGASYDFRSLGLRDLSAFVNFARGTGGRDIQLGVDQANEQEVNLTLDYKITEGRWRGFWFRVRGSLLRRDRAERDAREVRVVLNYDLPIL